MTHLNLGRKDGGPLAQTYFIKDFLSDWSGPEMVKIAFVVNKLDSGWFLKWIICISWCHSYYHKVTQILRDRSLKIIIHKTYLTFKYNDRDIRYKIWLCCFHISKCKLLLNDTRIKNMNVKEKYECPDLLAPLPKPTLI